MDELLKDAQRREAILAMGGIGNSAAQNLNTSSRSRRANNQAGSRAGSSALANSKEVTSSYDLITEAAKAYGASAKNGHRHVYALHTKNVDHYGLMPETTMRRCTQRVYCRNLPGGAATVAKGTPAREEVLRRHHAHHQDL